MGTGKGQALDKLPDPCMRFLPSFRSLHACTNPCSGEESRDPKQISIVFYAALFGTLSLQKSYIGRRKQVERARQEVG